MHSLSQSYSADVNSINQVNKCGLTDELVFHNKTIVFPKSNCMEIFNINGVAIQGRRPDLLDIPISTIATRIVTHLNTYFVTQLWLNLGDASILFLTIHMNVCQCIYLGLGYVFYHEL